MGMMRTILVGCGGISGAWLPAVIDCDDIDLVGLVDINPEHARNQVQRFNLDRVPIFTSLQQALDNLRFDAVFDLTVPAVHDQVTIAALEAGCHVLGEKPMSDSMAKARRMVQAANKAGRIYAVTQTRRPDPNVLRVTQLVNSGAIGQVEEIHCDFFIGAHFGGFRDEMDYPLLLDMAIHTFDTARQIAHADPVSAYCCSFNPARSWYCGDASASVIFEMKPADGDGHIVYNYRGSWCSEGLQTDWNAAWRIVGSKGSVLWNGVDQIHAQSVKEDGDHGFHSELIDLAIPCVEQKLSGHTYLIQQFARSVLSSGTEKVECPCDDNIKSLAMVMAAVQSDVEARKVNIADLL